MAGDLVHFELPAEDTARARDSWASRFGWRFQPWSGPVEYHMTDGLRPGGAIYPRQSSERGPIIYFDSDDIDATLARVRELGGSVTQDRSPIPGVGWYAMCADSEGNVFGLFQNDESVPASA